MDAIVFSPDAAKVRAFFADVLGMSSVDATRHRPHRTLNQAAPLARCPMVSPTWIRSGSSGVTVPEA